MKEFDRKDMFTIATIEGARKYINCDGYFCDSYYLDLNRWDKGILKDVNEDTTDYPFYLKPRKNCSNASFGFRFFIPVDKVKKYKKWRAFKDLNDFKTYAKKSVGSVLIYRKKNKNSTMKISMITNYVFDTNCISLGNLPFSLENLFDEYEWLDEHDIWQPFGVLENE